VLDLFMSKAVAGREKDREFCMALLQYTYVKPFQVLNLVECMPLSSLEQRKLRATIRRWMKVLREKGYDIQDA
jgi:hypothetical protein